MRRPWHRSPTTLARRALDAPADCRLKGLFHAVWAGQGGTGRVPMSADRSLDDDTLLPEALRRARFVQVDIYDAPEWYDVDYAGYRGEEAFYRLVLQSAVRAGGAVVELGVGTGRLALGFAESGYHVHGVEPASAMRALLERKAIQLEAAAHLLTVEAGSADDFRGPDGRVDVVMFPFNGILHLRTRHALMESFAHVNRRLARDGRFALDCTGPYWDAMLLGPRAWGRTDERVHPQSGRRVLTCDRSRYDPDTRQLRIDIRYLLEGESEGVEVALHQTMWTWQEILTALDASGFAVELLFGDVNLAPFEEGSPRLLVCCRKG